MHPSRCSLGFIALAIACAGARADTPPLLAKALQQWLAGQGEFAFTQQTKAFLADGSVKEERIERYDPSLPDSRRWRLIELDGSPATDEQSTKWESRKNARPRRKAGKSPLDFLDLDHTRLVGSTTRVARFQVPLKQVARNLVAVQEVDIVITVDRQSESIVGIGAALRGPIHVLLGLEEITDLGVDLRVNPLEEGAAVKSEEVQSGSTARVSISTMGRRVEYNWSDIRNVTPYAGRQAPR